MAEVVAYTSMAPSADSVLCSVVVTIEYVVGGQGLKIEPEGHQPGAQVAVEVLKGRPGVDIVMVAVVNEGFDVSGGDFVAVAVVNDGFDLSEVEGEVANGRLTV